MEAAIARIRELEAKLEVETAARLQAQTDTFEAKRNFETQVKSLKTSLTSKNEALLAMTEKYDNSVIYRTAEVTGLKDTIKRLEDQVRIRQDRFNSEKKDHDETKGKLVQSNKELRIAILAVKKHYNRESLRRARETTRYVTTEADPDKRGKGKYTHFMADRFINAQFDPTKKNSHELAIERGLKKIFVQPEHVKKIPQWAVHLKNAQKLANKKVHDFRVTDGIYMPPDNKEWLEVLQEVAKAYKAPFIGSYKELLTGRE